MWLPLCFTNRLCSKLIFKICFLARLFQCAFILMFWGHQDLCFKRENFIILLVFVPQDLHLHFKFQKLRLPSLATITSTIFCNQSKGRELCAKQHYLHQAANVLGANVLIFWPTQVERFYTGQLILTNMKFKRTACEQSHLTV